MALTIIDPKIYTDVIVPWYALHVLEPPAGASVENIDISAVTDHADNEPTFDTQHEVFTHSPVNDASQNSIGDNSNGLEDPLHLIPHLTYTYTHGYSSTHETSQGLTIGITQAFNYDFLGEGGSTTLSATGSFDWSQSTTNDHTSSISEGEDAPFDIPKGKIYEEKLLFESQQVQVPYSLTIHVDGQGDIHWDLDADGGTSHFTEDSSAIFNAVADGPGPHGGRGVPVPPYKDVNWSDFWGDEAGHGYYWLHGTLTVEGASTTSVKIYDITNGGSQVVQAEHDPAVLVGVHRTMDDTGRTFRDTPFDDWVDGGAGDDTIRFRGGEDIAYAGAGDDTIRALGVGRSVLDGGDGDDRIRLTSDVPGGTVLGGDGDDRIRVDAPAAMLYGGAGDDRYVLNGATAGGTVITDTEGHNRLSIDNGCVPLGFERLLHSDHLYILLGGGDTYDRTHDVVWLDFFTNPGNRVDGMRATEIAELATVFRITQAPGTVAEAML
jgi:Ca2+-binding RTX toxin-like protein